MLQILTQGTEVFNQRPDKGIQFLQENGLLNTQLDPVEVVKFLRENSGLDKAMIGDYISKKKNVESRILETFVKSFDFTNTEIDVALRQYLETFRLPGEAPLIFLVMEHFADHWHVSVLLFNEFIEEFTFSLSWSFAFSQIFLIFIGVFPGSVSQIVLFSIELSIAVSIQCGIIIVFL